MQARPIIGFCGLIGSGKTTAAKFLVENLNYKRIRFAGPLKDMAYAFGLSLEQVDGSEKEIPCEILGGKTPRLFMQLLGTEFGRNMIDKDIWINAWVNAVKKVPVGVGVVVDDCRFPNEATIIRQMSPKARICRIIRDISPTKQGHISELQAFQADNVIENNGTIDELYQKVEQLAHRVANSHR